MNLVIVGYQIKYDSWANWRFVAEHPGEIPECHADREIRPVYADLDAPVERQHWVRPPTVYVPYE